MRVRHPHLWSPCDPYLYRLNLRVMDGNPVGWRHSENQDTAEFRGKEGFYLNGKPYGQLVGANRHQDFGYVGNALPNSQQWRDAKSCVMPVAKSYARLNIPRSAFMDASTNWVCLLSWLPGWQYEQRS